MPSGSTDWTRTRDQIIARALRIVGALGMGDTPPTAAYNEGSEALNAIVKQLQTKGVRLWTQDWLMRRVSNPDQCSVDGANYICIRPIASAESYGDYTPSDGSLWTMYWIDGGESGASIATETESTTSYSPVNIFSTPSNVLDIERMYVRDGEDDYPIEKITMREYLNIENKYTSDIPQKFVFQRSLEPQVHIYPLPDDADYVLYYLATTSVEDFDSSGDLPDFPVRYIEFLTWALADRLASEKRLTIAERTYIEQRANILWQELIRDDNENVDTEFINNAY